MMIKAGLLLAAAFVGVFGNELNRGNVALELSRSPRSAQQPQNFPAMPNFPILPNFDNSQIVSQDTDSNRNGFAQTTIYKSANGMGASSVSVSRNGTGSLQKSFSWMLTLLAALPLFTFIRALK